MHGLPWNNAVLVLELAQQAVKLYESGSADKKRKLVEIVCSNRFLVNGTLRFDYQKPFDILSKVTDQEHWWTLADVLRTACIEYAQES